MIELMEARDQEAIIKVIGVGGCGGNAVNHMIECGVSGVEFISLNTDMKALKQNKAPVALQLGNITTKGLGAGANPDIGRQSALEDRDRVTDLIQGADMLFITAGMGGGTGTGAAPVIAELAREMGILTVAVVTKPFAFEGKRMKIAQLGIEALQRHVDSLIIIPNDRLLEVLGDDVSTLDAFRASNDVLRGAVAGIAEVINCPGLVGVDFADVRTVMTENGVAMMGSAAAAGQDRAQVAAERAVANPLLEEINLAGARGVLVNITADPRVKLKEINEAMSVVRSFTADDATIIYGQVFDENMGDEMRVTVVATGLNTKVQQRHAKPELQVLSPPVMEQPLAAVSGSDVDFAHLDAPAVFRARNRTAIVDAHRSAGMDTIDIPAFLRKQAD